MGVDLLALRPAESGTKAQSARATGGITFIRMDGSLFKPDKPPSSLSLRALGRVGFRRARAGSPDAAGRHGRARRAGRGEPYWLQEPSDEHLRACGLTRDAFGSHAENVETGQRRGLDLVHTIPGEQQDDWDR